MPNLNDDPRKDMLKQLIVEAIKDSQKQLQQESKQEAAKKKKEDDDKKKNETEITKKLDELAKKYKNNEDTLADAIEYKRLLKLNKKFPTQALIDLDKNMKAVGKGVLGAAGNTIKAGANLVGGTAKAGIGLAGDVANTLMSNKFISGFGNAMMYSNPVTALIAENADLFKGVFKAGLSSVKAVAGVLKGTWNTAGTAIKGVGDVAWNTRSALYNLKKLKRKKNNSEEDIDDEDSLLPSASSLLAASQSGGMLNTDGVINISGATVNISDSTVTLQDNVQTRIDSDEDIIEGEVISSSSSQQPISRMLPDNLSGSIESNKSIEETSLPLLTSETNTIKTIQISQEKETKKAAKDALETKKYLQSIERETKKGNTLLTEGNKKTMLVVGGILLGIAAIWALVQAVKNIKFPIPHLPKLPKPPNTGFSSDLGLDPNAGFNMISNTDHAKESLDTVKKNVETSLKLDKGITGNSLIKGVRNKPKGVTFNSSVGAPYRAPFDLKILEIKNNSGTQGDYDMRVMRMDQQKSKVNRIKTVVSALTLKNGRNNPFASGHEYWLMNIIPLYGVEADYDNARIYKKGTIIGFVGKNGKINIKAVNENIDIRNEFAIQAYQDMVNSSIGKDNLGNSFSNYTQKDYDTRTETYKAGNYVQQGVGGLGGNSVPVTASRIKEYRNQHKKQTEEAKMMEDLKNKPTEISAPKGYADSFGMWHWYPQYDPKNNKNDKNNNKPKSTNNSSNNKSKNTNKATNKKAMNNNGTSVAYVNNSKSQPIIYGTDNGSDISAQTSSILSV